MAATHDCEQQVSWLQQSLMHDKKSIGFLLGAGCPLAIRVPSGTGTVPLIPDIAGLTRAVHAEVTATTSPASKSYAILQQHFVDDGRASPTIEHLLSHVRALSRVAGKQSARGLTAPALEELEAVICDIIVRAASASLPVPTSPYSDLARWIGSLKRDASIEVFTTNYDLLMEQAFEENRVPFFDGFVGSRYPFFDAHAVEDDVLPGRWARLWKLHGSVNWRQDGNGRVSRRETISPSERRLIHPSHLKYDESRRMPYLAMIDRLRAFLRRPAPVLLTAGFSFGDEHLNEVIVESLQGNTTAAAFVFAYGKLDEHGALPLAIRRTNLSLLASDGAVVGGRRGDWSAKSGATFASAAVDWKSTNPGDAAATMKPEFRLGDFGRLGAFLADLVGSDGA